MVEGNECMACVQEMPPLSMRRVVCCSSCSWKFLRPGPQRPPHVFRRGSLTSRMRGLRQLVAACRLPEPPPGGGVSASGARIRCRAQK